ncbi:MAG TPA: hypothetical protein VFZ97_04420 [Acidimicrobiales bacterium]
MEGNDSWIAVGEKDVPILLGSLAGIERRPGSQKRLLTQAPEPQEPLDLQPLDLVRLAPLEDVRPTPASSASRFRRELHIPNPKGHRRLRDS